MEAVRSRSDRARCSQADRRLAPNATADAAAMTSTSRGSRRPVTKRSRDACKRVKLQWMPHEDSKLADLVSRHGAQNWNIIAAELDGRSSKNCRLRWCNQLNPTLNKAPFSAWEDAVVYQGFKTHGTRWALIAKMLHGRTDNSVKNRWNCVLKRREELGIHIENDFISSAKSLEDLLAQRPSRDTPDAPARKTDEPSCSPGGMLDDDDEAAGWLFSAYFPDESSGYLSGSAPGSSETSCSLSVMKALDPPETSVVAADYNGRPETFSTDHQQQQQQAATTAGGALPECSVLFPSSISWDYGLDSFSGWPPSEPASSHPGSSAMSCAQPFAPWPSSSEAHQGGHQGSGWAMAPQQFQQQTNTNSVRTASMDDVVDCFRLPDEFISIGQPQWHMGAAPPPLAQSHGHRTPSCPSAQHVQERQFALDGLSYGPNTVPTLDEGPYGSWGVF